MPEDETPHASVKDQDERRAERSFSKLRWLLIGIFGFLVVSLQLSIDPVAGAIEAAIYILIIFVVAILHGIERYGAKGTVIFFLIVSAVVLILEVSGIQTGEPFGIHYHYAIPAFISIFGMPLIGIFAYFDVGYFAWVLSHVLTGQWTKKLRGKWIVVVPLVATFIMVMWDVGMDPIYSAVLKEWVWDVSGPYFGVPIMNFVGWFIMVFIFYQLFGLFLSKYDRINPQKVATLTSRPYWIEAAVVYGLVGLSSIVIPIRINNDITQSMALVNIFTMIFVAIISFIAITNNNELS